MKHWLITNWSGILCGPVIWLLFFIFLGFSNRQIKAIREWYIGIAINQWWAMWLVVIGCKILRNKNYCLFIPHEGRFWLSPNVKGFKQGEE